MTHAGWYERNQTKIFFLGEIYNFLNDLHIYIYIYIYIYIWMLPVQSWLRESNNTGILNTCTRLWLTESEQATPGDSIKDVVRSSVKVPEFDKHLKKAGGHIGWNVMKIAIKMKTIVRKPLMIYIYIYIYIYISLRKSKTGHIGMFFLKKLLLCDVSYIEIFTRKP